MPVIISNNSVFDSSIGFGSTLYVGGIGPGNFTSIQDAIDRSSNGYTVFVYNGTYYENIIIKKLICLKGEDKNITIIDGGMINDVISVYTSGVTISGFTIKNSGNTPMVDAGIELYSNDNEIIGNIVSDNGDYAVGIFLNESSNNIIKNNHIYRNGNEGIYLARSMNNFIQNNSIFNNGHCSIVISHSSYNRIINNSMYENNDAGVSLWPGATYNEIAFNTVHDLPYSGIGIWQNADDNYIHDNQLFNNPLYGVKIRDAKRNVIEHNIISGSEKGVILSHSSFTSIKKNNFANNVCHAIFDNSSINYWIRNYWDDHIRFRPKRIDGEICLPWNQTIIIRWINFDWFPKMKPYEIR
jgi:parallel beta-helix repeat protein